MDFEIDKTLENSQVINIQSLLANDLQGPTLFRLLLKNQNSSEQLKDLYLRVVIDSDRIGRILEVRQVSGRPFSLDPGQQVFVNNNNSGNGLPGIEERIAFEHDYTRRGREFYNGLKGLTSLPADRYQVTVEIYRGSINGELLASQTDDFGTNLVENTRGFYLLAPGDELGSETIISSRYPNFQWQGRLDIRYRLVVVESRTHESAQSLMDGAISTEPIELISSSGAGSLLDYEILDILVDGSGYQYPSSGVQDLEPGTRYFWRIISQLETSDGIEERESEIWSFTMADLRKSSGDQQAIEISRILERILGDRYEEVRQNGFSLESVEIEGQRFHSGQAVQKLRELDRKNEQGDVSILIEN
ncbi:hypothetical protein [Fodinibius sp. AD559]|uniref:hypothetical protein n=1 Tax=Fodinibius sp. AD559 TaxID=3424179 RepID=UPI0040469843